MIIVPHSSIAEAASAGELESIFESINEAIVRIDRDWRVSYVNNVYLRFSGLTRLEVMGRTPFDFAPSFKTSIFHEPIFRCQSERRETRQISFSPVLGIWVRVRVVPYLDGSVIMISRATSESVKDHLRSERAETDPLTGLGNRLALEDRIDRLRRAKATFRLAVIALNNLSSLNSAHGYASSDLVTLQIASRLRERMWEGENLYRIESDQFSAILFSDVAGIDTRLRDFLSHLGKPITLPTGRVFVESAAGVTDSDFGAKDFETLLRQCGLALSAARVQSRQRHDDNAICVYHAELELESQLRTALQDDLRLALDGQQFLLHVQPKISLATGRVVGGEALMRWAHPRRGLLTPGHFMQAAHEIGAMPALDRWTMQAAASMARSLRDVGHALPVSLNLGVGALGDPTLPDRCQSLLESVGIEPGLLEIEIPEGALVEDLEASTDILNRLHRLGVRLSIDDFGTGYASFAYLARFPVQTLKIDRSFVHELDRSRSHRKVVQGIIKMAHHLGMEVVAEGVETATQAEALKRMQCDAIQGYVFARPMPVEEFIRFVDEHPGVTLPDPRSI